VFAGTSVWTGNGSAGTLSEISPVLRKRVDGIDLPGKHSLIVNSVNALAAGDGSLWAAMSTGDVLRVSPHTHAILKRFHVGAAPFGIAYGADAVWLLTGDNRLLRIEPRTNKISGERLVGYPAADSVTTGGAHVLVGVFPSFSANAVVQMLDAGSLQPEWTSNSVPAPVAIALGRGAVWVASPSDKKVYRLDPASGRVMHVISVGGAPAGVAVVGDEVWVTIEQPEG
jgi:DNA-binding beta-propeller fold protein YncE